jgi:aldose 1-epimerase
VPEGSSTEIRSIDDLSVALLHEPATGSDVEVVLGLGANLHRFCTRVDGRSVDVLAAASSLADMRERPVAVGSAALFPYPGRVRDGRFPFRGREIQLRAGPGPGGHAIHGVVLRRAFQPADVEPGAARVVAVLDSRAAGVTADDWPWPFTLRLTTTLSDGVVRVDIEAVNQGEESMPMGLGFHPYLPAPVLPGGIHEDCVVWFDADELWPQTPPGLPTGEIRPLAPDHPLRRGARLGDLPEDVPTPRGDVRNLVLRRTGGGVRAGLRDERAGVELEVSASPEFGALVFFTPPSPSVVSFEPHTCVPDAFNLKERGLPTGYLELAPGAPWRGWYQLQARAI